MCGMRRGVDTGVDEKRCAKRCAKRRCFGAVGSFGLHRSGRSSVGREGCGEEAEPRRGAERAQVGRDGVVVAIDEAGLRCAGIK